MRKIFYFLLTVLIIVGIIFGGFQMYFSIRAFKEDFRLTPSTYITFESEIISINNHNIRAKVVDPSLTEPNVTRTISANIDERTVIKDRNGNSVDISTLTAGQKVLIWVMDGVIYEYAVHTDTHHHEAYIGCYEIKIID